MPRKTEMRNIMWGQVLSLDDADWLVGQPQDLETLMVEHEDVHQAFIQNRARSREEGVPA